MLSEETRSKWDFKIKEINKVLHKLNDYELDFMEGISYLRNLGEDVSFRQSQLLNKIYDKINK